MCFMNTNCISMSKINKFIWCILNNITIIININLINYLFIFRNNNIFNISNITIINIIIWIINKL